jgi:hypothetical protein
LKEGVESNKEFIESIILTKNLPVTKIQIEYAGALMTSKEDSWLNLNNMTIYDISGTKVDYWSGKNNVRFLKENIGKIDKGIENLWDEKDSTTESSLAPETLIVQFGNEAGIYLDSIYLTNRKDCCENRIQNYKLVLYNMNEIIGSVSLIQLDEKGKTIKYTLLYPNGVKGNKDIEAEDKETKDTMSVSNRNPFYRKQD